MSAQAFVDVTIKRLIRLGWKLVPGVEPFELDDAEQIVNESSALDAVDAESSGPELPPNGSIRI